MVDSLYKYLFKAIKGDAVEVLHSKSYGVLGLFMFMNKFKPDVFHDNGIWYLFHVKNFIFSKILNFKYIVSPHGCLEPFAMKHKGFKKYMAWYMYQKLILQFSDGIIVNSHKEYQRLRDLGLKKPIAIIENAISIKNGAGNTPYGDKEVTNKALFLSRIHPIKGITTLLKSWSISQAYLRNNYSLHLYGNIDDQEYFIEIKNLIKKLGLENNVFYKGEVYGDDKWDVYNEHDFFILPSHSENFGIVILEALYAGLPVITTTGTPWAGLNDLGLGVVVECEKIELQKAIDTIITKYFNNGIISSELRNKAKSYVVNNFMWSSVVDKYIEYYGWLLGHNEKPSFVYEED